MYHADLVQHNFNRGYEVFRSQNFEKRGAGDLKEGFSIGRHKPLDHEDVRASIFGQGPNVYPVELSSDFQTTMETYFEGADQLSRDLLRALALTLGQDEAYFDNEGYCQQPLVELMRLLHYPPQPVDAPENERGIGAHTDFGSVTILLQDDNGGLQVYDADEGEWIDIQPQSGALVINLGNMAMIWSNDKYISALHRVINNRSGENRYSVPFFFDGNARFTIQCLSGSEGPLGAKYAPISVRDLMEGRYLDTYGGEMRGEDMSKPVKAIGERRLDYLAGENNVVAKA